MVKKFIVAAMLACIASPDAQAQVLRVSQENSGPPLPSPRQYLVNRLQGGMTLDRFLASLRGEFERQDADGNDVFDQDDIDLQVKIGEAGWRTTFVMQIMPADLDGDGYVTEQELRQKLQYDMRRNGTLLQPARPGSPGPQERIEQSLRKTMEADTDKDGRLSIKEAMDYAASQRVYAQGTVNNLRIVARQMLSLAREGKTALTSLDVENAASAYFRAVDKDGNGTISLDELDAERRDVNRERMEAARPPAPDKVQPGCDLPKASQAAKVVLLGSYQTESLSTVALGSQSDVTGVGNVVVEPGREPLYLVIATMRPTIWRFYGAVERIERAVLSSNGGVQSGEKPRIAAGATGLPADRVTFPERTGCMRYFSNVPSTDSAKAAGFVRTMTGKAPEMVSGKYAIVAFSVPSGKIESVGPDRPGLTIVQNGTSYILNDGKITAVKPDRQASSDLDRYSPGGVVTIDAKAVVASVPAEPYEVLPQEAGLLQLVGSGALTRSGGEYIINRKIRIPAGLNGAHSVKFLLRKGVPEPDGDYGHSTVISEETGEALKPKKG
ncbi:EF-hand domain-containing protein [Pseudolabrys sp. FHR47]|uniref:EF-hand domain-containing protein n=1 Tax=Pseudolabrys sp. FHR47 TaxID=2562284 RepID=UPI0010BE8113|nr:hypothetical protein [Pseudolabrys sp. FHR47]